MKSFVSLSTFILILFGGLSLIGCKYFEAKHDPGSGQPSGKLGKPTAEFVGLDRAIFKPLWVDCHSGASAPHKIELNSYEKIMSGSVFPPLVVPGDPEGSSLYQSIANGSMPKNRRKLTNPERIALYNWIKNGALKEPGNKPPCTGNNCEPPKCEMHEPCECGDESIVEGGPDECEGGEPY